MLRAARRSWGLILFTALAALAVLGAVLCLALYTDPREARALKTRGALIAATHGTEPLVLGANWQKVLLRVTPRLQKWVGGASVSPPPTTRPGSLVVWQSLGPIGWWEGPAPQLGAVLTDDRGDRLKVEAWTGEFPMTGPAVLAFELETLPRRGKQIRIHSNEWHLDERLFPDLLVANPTPGDYPQWAPTPLPATQRDRNVEVTLATAIIGSPLPPFLGERERTIMSLFEDHGRLELAVRENGQSAAHAWEIVHVEIRDPTGNTWRFPKPFTTLQDNRILVGLAPIDLLDEPAHRVRIELVRVARHSDRRAFEFLVPITRSASARSGWRLGLCPRLTLASNSELGT